MIVKKLLNKFIGNKSTKVPFPSEVFLLLEDRCNARCTMCQENYFQSDTGKAITLDKFKIIAQNIMLQNMKTVVLSGGEPFLNRDLFEIISFINNYYPHILITICTNGIALTEERTEEILKRKIHSINVSINAGSKEIYRKMAQVDCFEKVVENLKCYQGLCLKLGKPSRLNLSFVANRKNIEDLPEFIKLAKSLGIENLSSTYCRFFPEEKRSALAINKDNILKNDDSLYFHQDISDRYFKEADIMAKRFGINFVHESLFSKKTSKQRCRFPFSSIMVGFNGEIFPCCGGEVIFKGKVNSGVYDFGNALNQPIETFWYNKYYQALRYSVLHPDKPAVPECGVCTNILKWKGHIGKAHIMEWDDLGEKTKIPNAT